MAQQLVLGRLQNPDIQKRVEIAERDIRRDNAFKKVQYEENGRFNISYQREGYIISERSFDFVRLNSRFLTLKYNKNTGEITVLGGKPNESHAVQLEKAGLKFNGVLRVWTNALPTKHNSKNFRPQGKLVIYTWDIKNLRQKVPFFKFVPQIQ
tara:strand:+ start:8456 stop:8914 length:459 start_codon:yes stop_codon:yes gene_type:complete